MNVSAKKKGSRDFPPRVPISRGARLGNDDRASMASFTLSVNGDERVVEILNLFLSFNPVFLRQHSCCDFQLMLFLVVEGHGRFQRKKVSRLFLWLNWRGFDSSLLVEFVNVLRHNLEHFVNFHRVLPLIR